MAYRVQRGNVAALIEPRGAMVSPEFVLGEELVKPFYRAPWDSFEDPLLDHLQGDFPCVPFGIAPASMEGFPPPWNEMDPGHTQFGHGYSANAEWELTEADDSAVLRLRLPAGEPARWIRRTVLCAEPWVEIEDEIAVDADVSLPLGLHPMFRLPSEVGGARLVLPGCRALLTTLVPNDPSSVLKSGAEFADARRAPLRDGGDLDLTSLPLPMVTEELVFLAEVAEPRIVLENLSEGYRLILEWDATHLSHCLLWFSNGGRSAPPWDGRNLCLGVEPLTSAFDLGPAIATSDNPLSARGIRTTVELSSEHNCVLRHRFRVEALG